MHGLSIVCLRVYDGKRVSKSGRCSYELVNECVHLLYRVCVDLCSNMVPGEGMLVGSFARGLFLVHSECAESAYINSRPFRVNAGPVSIT